MSKKTKSLLINIAFPLIGISAFLIIWAIGAAAYNKPFILPSPIKTIKRAGELLLSTEFYYKFLLTFLRAVAAFAVSYIIGLILAVACARNEAKKIIAPFVALIRSLPTVAVITIILLWTSTSMTPIFVAVLVILPTLYSSFSAGMDKVEKELTEIAFVFGASRVQTARYIYLPSLYGNLIENAASGISMTLKLIVSAELLAGTVDSVGRLIKDFDIRFDTAGLMATAVLTAFFCIVLEYLIRIPLYKKS